MQNCEICGNLWKSTNSKAVEKYFVVIANVADRNQDPIASTYVSSCIHTSASLFERSFPANKGLTEEPFFSLLRIWIFSEPHGEHPTAIHEKSTEKLTTLSLALGTEFKNARFLKMNSKKCDGGETLSFLRTSFLAEAELAS